ncbi:MAG: hypothetical protein V7638_3823 [Acidobacteriota bacterium]|jgi:HK97 gp10 family phage protein
MFALGVKITKRNRIPELRRSLRPRAEKILDDAATQIASLARQLCPVGETGNLRDSIAIETYSGHRPGFGVAKSVVVGMFYAPYVEFGTVNSPAQPFLMPAFESVKPNVVRAFERIAKR